MTAKADQFIGTLTIDHRREVLQTDERAQKLLDWFPEKKLVPVNEFLELLNDPARTEFIKRIYAEISTAPQSFALNAALKRGDKSLKISAKALLENDGQRIGTRLCFQVRQQRQIQVSEPQTPAWLLSQLKDLTRELSDLDREAAHSQIQTLSSIFVRNAQSTQSEEPATETSAPESKDKLQILVAEDNYANRLVLNTILDRMGHQAVLVENGAEALEVCKQSHFDLILMDIQMPVLDGYSATTALRESGWNGPIFALTAHGNAETREKSLAAGMDEVMYKPFNSELFEQTLARMNTHRSKVAGAADRQPQLATIGNDHPLVDDAFLKSLLDMAGDAGATNMISAFDDALVTLTSDLSTALKDGDASLIHKAAHTLKGAALNMGANRVAKIAETLQDAPEPDRASLEEQLNSAIAETRDKLTLSKAA